MSASFKFGPGASVYTTPMTLDDISAFRARLAAFRKQDPDRVPRVSAREAYAEWGPPCVWPHAVYTHWCRRARRPHRSAT